MFNFMIFSVFNYNSKSSTNISTVVTNTFRGWSLSLLFGKKVITKKDIITSNDD